MGKKIKCFDASIVIHKIVLSDFSSCKMLSLIMI